MSIPKSIAVRTSFSHHAAHAGYKQILKYTAPEAVLGFNEHKPEELSSLKRRYHFLVEWDAKASVKKHKAEVLHILYGEEYYRFSKRLNKDLPIVVTFHQPPEVLEQEVMHGSIQGRVGQLTHWMTKDRFEKLDQAIVMTNAQKDVLSQVMPASRISVIPLGADIQHLKNWYEKLDVTPISNQILTVGQWMRDWDFYFQFLQYAQTHHPKWHFVLINRKLPQEYKAQVPDFPNLTYMDSVSDEALFSNYKSAYVQFLPFIGAAGNNSLNEGFAMGAPAVTNVLNQDYIDHEDFVGQYPSGDVAQAAQRLDFFLSMDAEERFERGQKAQKAVMEYDWSSVARKTLEVYHKAIQS
ncbi:MAG: glycosyltransferase [Bacteroidota bacterium]